MDKIEFLIDFLNSQVTTSSDQVCLNMAEEATEFANSNASEKVVISFDAIAQRFYLDNV